MNTTETSKTLNWRKIPASGLERVWTANRPEESVKGRQPYVSGFALLRVESCTTGGTTGPLWFMPLTTKDLLFSEKEVNKKRRSIIENGVAPGGFITQDILRAMDAVNGIGKKPGANTLGWIVVCTAPRSIRKLNTTFPADYVANSAKVVALCRVVVKAVRP